MSNKEVCQDFEKNYSYLAWKIETVRRGGGGGNVSLPEIAQNKP